MRKTLVALSLAFASACVGDDSVNPPDASGDVTSPDGGTCSGGPTCKDPSTLETCTSGQSTTTPCALGCLTTGGAHCAVFQPTAPVQASDFTTAGVTDVVVTTTGFIDTGTGAIDNVRAANGDPNTLEIKSGVGFHVVNGVGVFVFQNFTINDGVTLQARGVNALAIVGTQKVVVKGILDARGWDDAAKLCTNGTAGPGGAAGGGQDGNSHGVDGSGAGGGKGQGTYTTAGPGGGGFGGKGGNGGAYPGSGGATTVLATPIVGGSGGGGSSGAYGGGGGGAVQIASPVEIDVGGGANPGGINVGGCGGHGGFYGNTGGGGGSGGAILLQSPVVSVLAQGGLAANGGAGSTGNGASDGSPGLLGTTSPGAAAGTSGYGNAGAGAYGSSYDGSAGGAGTNYPGGGGGGGVGRIRIENQSGTLTLPNGAFTSPTLATTTGAPATVGLITTQ